MNFVSSTIQASEKMLFSRTWGDNWQVEGVKEFEDQRYSTSTPKKSEVVPFLVPTSQTGRVRFNE